MKKFTVLMLVVSAVLFLAPAAQAAPEVTLPEQAVLRIGEMLCRLQAMFEGIPLMQDVFGFLSDLFAMLFGIEAPCGEVVP